MQPRISWLRYRFCGVAVALVPLMMACGTGALGQSRLLDEPSAAQTGMQGPIAVGAWITPTIDLGIAGSGAPSMQMVSARPDVLAAEDHRLTGRSPGVSAVLITADTGTVLDFIHLWVVEPTRVMLAALDPSRRRRGEIADTIELLVGESLYVAPVVYAGSQELAGTAEATWRIAEPIADILHDGNPDRRRLVARTPGRATVSVTMLGLESSFDLVVVPR